MAQTKNGLLVVDPRDFGVSRSLLSHGSYDWTAIVWLSRLLNQESRIVVVGAHLGAVLVPLALRSGARKVVAFEPNPSSHRLLQINLALNGLVGVTVHQSAVGRSEGSVRFTLNPINSGNSRVAQTGEIEVALTTLDAVIQADPSAVDLVVMDTEGFESHAIQGGLRTLARTRYFYVEYSPEQLVEQGSSPREFIELIAGCFDSMYLPGQSDGFFASRTYVSYLTGLRARRGLLLNLLFSNDTSPHQALLTSPQ